MIWWLASVPVTVLLAAVTGRVWLILLACAYGIAVLSAFFLGVANV